MSTKLSFKRHRFPPDVIRYAVWLYFRFTLSFRDVEELLAERGIEVSYETIRCWTIKFGAQIRANLNAKRPAPSPRWHLDEMVCSVGGKRMYLWRGRRRGRDPGDDHAAGTRRFDRNSPADEAAREHQAGPRTGRHRRPWILCKRGQIPASRAPPFPGAIARKQPAENSHLPIRRRERKMQKFKSQASAQRFLDTFSAVYNTFYTQRHLTSRNVLRKLRGNAFGVWSEATAA